MGFQRWLNSNVMAAQAIPNLFGLKVIPQLMALGFINACVAIALEQRT
jgi:hypothetical protein